MSPSDSRVESCPGQDSETRRLGDSGTGTPKKRLESVLLETLIQKLLAIKLYRDVRVIKQIINTKPLFAEINMLI